MPKKKDTEETALQRQSQDLLTQANSLSVLTDEEYEEAGFFLLGVKSLKTEITSHYEPMRKSTYEAYQSVLKSKKSMLDPLDEAEKSIKGSMSKFLSAREEEQRQIESEIKKGGEGQIVKAPKIQGVSTYSEWDFRVVKESDIDSSYWVPDEKLIRQMVKSLGKEAEEVVGGIEVFEIKKIRGAR